MIISCPSCQKRYLVDESVLSDQGREVRCGVCGTTWVETPKPTALPLSTLEIDAVHGVARIKKRSKAVPGIFLFLTLATLILTGFYMARFPLLKWAPSLKPVFESMGIGSIHPTDGLSFGGLTPLQTTLGHKPALVVRGVISNAALEARELSELSITVYGSCKDVPWHKKIYYTLSSFSDHDHQCPLDHWRHKLSQTRLMPGENLAFETHPRVFQTVPTSVHVEFN